jgi:hypothetical protein
MAMAEVGVGTPGGTERPFHHGDLQPKKKKLVSWKKRRIIFERSWAILRKGLKS